MEPGERLAQHDHGVAGDVEHAPPGHPPVGREARVEQDERGHVGPVAPPRDVEPVGGGVAREEAGVAVDQRVDVDVRPVGLARAPRPPVLHPLELRPQGPDDVAVSVERRPHPLGRARA